MNTNAEFERIVRDWLRDRAVEPSPGLLAPALERVAETPQRRRRWLRRWFGRDGGTTRGAAGRGTRNDVDQGRNRRMFSITVAATVAAMSLLAVVIAPAGEPAISSLPATGSGATLVVAADGSGEFSTISDAIAEAVDGDTVLVRPGQYLEVLVIEKDITVQGDGPRDEIVVAFPAGGPRVDLGGLMAEISIQLTGSHGVVRGLSTGPVLIDGGAPTLEDVVVWRRSDIALAIGSGSAPIIRDSEVTGVVGTDGLGVSPTLDGNTFSGGIVSIDGPGEITITDNTFRVSEGISASHGLTGIIDGNEFLGSRVGVDTSSQLTVRDNTFRDVPGTDGRAAIEVRDGDTSARILDNELVDNKIGISWANSEGVIEGNIIRGGTAGIVVLSGAPAVTGNDIEGASYRGIAVSDWASPTLTGNTVCSCGENLHVDQNASATLRDNEICADGAAG